MANEYLYSQEFINDIHTGREMFVKLALDQKGAIFKVNGIISAVNHKIVSKSIIDKIRDLKNDNTIISGFYVSDFAAAALDALGMEKYKGNSERIKELIISKLEI